MLRCAVCSIPLLTTKALWPLGIMWRVFLLEPYPICEAFRQPWSIKDSVSAQCPLGDKILPPSG